MENEENVLLVPGTFRFVKQYGDFNGLDIWIRDEKMEISESAGYLIGHSLGANYILNSGFDSGSKFIFINPLVKKRNRMNLFVRWVKFLVFEGFGNKKVVPVRHWTYVLKQVFFLLRVDVLAEMRKIPKENVIVIRGKQDRFFCDCEDVKVLDENDFKSIEVDAGHDWNDNIAKAVRDIINAQGLC